MPFWFLNLMYFNDFVYFPSNLTEMSSFANNPKKGYTETCISLHLFWLVAPFLSKQVWMRLLVLAGLMQIRYELFNRDSVVNRAPQGSAGLRRAGFVLLW